MVCQDWSMDRWISAICWFKFEGIGTFDGDPAANSPGFTVGTIGHLIFPGKIGGLAVPSGVINGWKIHQSFWKKKLHENRELLVGGLFAVPTSLVAVLVGATFPATGLRCLKKSGAVLESPGGTECCECCECEWDTGEGNSYFFFLIRMCISVWWFHVVVSYLQLYLFLFIGI